MDVVHVDSNSEDVRRTNRRQQRHNADVSHFGLVVYCSASATARTLTFVFAARLRLVGLITAEKSERSQLH